MPCRLFLLLLLASCPSPVSLPPPAHPLVMPLFGGCVWPNPDGIVCEADTHCHLFRISCCMFVCSEHGGFCFVRSRVRGGVGISACRPVLCRAVPCRNGGGGGQRGLVPLRDYVWCLVCSRVREGGGRNLRVPPRFVPCRAVPPMGGGGKEALCRHATMCGALCAVG